MDFFRFCVLPVLLLETFSKSHKNAKGAQRPLVFFFCRAF